MAASDDAGDSAGDGGEDGAGGGGRSNAAVEAAVEAVVFDFGGVLITPITNQLSEVAAAHGVTGAVMKEVLLGPPTSSDHPWHRAERGEIPVVEIQRRLQPWASPFGIDLVGDEIDRLLVAGGYTLVESMIDRARSLLGSGVATALLTNTFVEFRPTMDADIGLDSFDHVVESFAVGARKPEPAIYAATERALGLDGSSIVYLDDFAENLAPAQALGWRTIHVTDPAIALAELDSLLA